MTYGFAAGKKDNSNALMNPFAVQENILTASHCCYGPVDAMRVIAGLHQFKPRADRDNTARVGKNLMGKRIRDKRFSATGSPEASPRFVQSELHGPRRPLHLAPGRPAYLPRALHVSVINFVDFA